VGYRVQGSGLAAEPFGSTTLDVDDYGIFNADSAQRGDETSEFVQNIFFTVHSLPIQSKERLPATKFQD
jgi:hypothetical protein